MVPREELGWAVKRAIVQRLACYETPTQLAKVSKADFGLELSRQRIEYYDPTIKAGAALDPILKALFEETRAKFLKDIEAIPIANKAVRLAMLNRMAVLAEGRGQIPEVRATLEQAAKEAGDAFTNERKLKHSGPNGEPLPAATSSVTIFQLPDNGRGTPVGTEPSSDRPAAGTADPIPS